MISHVVVLGLMGAGKTTVGRQLAERLGWPLSDSDEEITRRYGATVRVLNDRLGTDGMHRLEAEHLQDALAQPSPSVIAAAASVVEDPDCRRALEQPQVYVVWLRGQATTLAERFAGQPHRPVFGRDTLEVIREQMEHRDRWFAEVADQTVGVEHQAPGEIADQILAGDELRAV